MQYFKLWKEGEKGSDESLRLLLLTYPNSQLTQTLT